MKKHWKKALFLFLALILLLSVPAAAKTVRKVWRTENGTTYYYKNGRAVKGIRTIGKKTYFFDKKGRLAKNRWVWSKGKKYRTNSKGQIRKNGFITVSGKKYLLNADGSVAKGFKKRGENWYYFTKDGSMATGLTKIGKNTYYFNKKGIRQTGEKKIGNTTYYFQNDGKLEAKKTVKKGKTTYYGNDGKKLTGSALEKRKTLERAEKIAAKITNASMSKAQKMRTCFDYVVKFPYVTRRTFGNFDGWVNVYANDIFQRGGGNCQSDACAFAFLAKALGCSNVYVCVDSDGTNPSGHSWAEVDGLVYDPLFAEAKGYSTNYGVPYGTYILHPILKVEI